MNCNLVGASEMGEHGLDQLKIPCITVGKPFWKRNAGFAGVVIVTAVSAFKSHEIVPKCNREIKINHYFCFSPFLIIFSFLRLFTTIIIPGSSHHTPLTLLIFYLLDPFRHAVTLFYFYFSSLHSFTSEIPIPSLFWRVSHLSIVEP